MSSGSFDPAKRGARPARGYASPTFRFGEARMPEPGNGVAAVVLAAGRGSRFGDDPKPLARLGPRTMLGHSVASPTSAGLRPIVVVVGYRGDDVAKAAGTLAEIVENPAWEEGMSTSLRAGLAALVPDPGVSAAVIVLADQPRVGADAYRRVVAAHQEGAALAVATYGGQRGHPVLIGREHWAEAMKLTGDEGARSLLAAHAVVEVPCDGTGSSADVDTPADLQTL